MAYQYGPRGDERPTDIGKQMSGGEGVRIYCSGPDRSRRPSPGERSLDLDPDFRLIASGRWGLSDGDWSLAPNTELLLVGPKAFERLATAERLYVVVEEAARPDDRDAYAHSHTCPRPGNWSAVRYTLPGIVFTNDAFGLTITRSEDGRVRMYWLNRAPVDLFSNEMHGEVFELTPGRPAGERPWYIAGQVMQAEPVESLEPTVASTPAIPELNPPSDLGAPLAPSTGARLRDRSTRP